MWMGPLTPFWAVPDQSVVRLTQDVDEASLVVKKHTNSYAAYGVVVGAGAT